MDIAALSRAVGCLFYEKSDTNILLQTSMPNLMLLETPETTAFEATIYNPMICLILQGAKEITIAGETVSFGAGESLVIAHDLPVSSRITLADPTQPYRAILITLDIEIIRSLYDQVSDGTFADGDYDVLGISQTTPALIDALGRYLSLEQDAQEAEVLGPMVLREIHFRLLIAPNGGMLRRLLRRDSHASRIGLAIAQIRTRFRSMIPVSELAQVAGMSPSSFHEHFRAVTATTPLQFQKDLRLVEARRLLVEQGLPVSSTAYEVGYESATQFSREYTRKFGASPRAHLMQSKAAAA